VINDESVHMFLASMQIKCLPNMSIAEAVQIWIARKYSRIIFFLLIVSYCQKAQKAQQGSTRLNKAWKSEDAWYLSGLINMSFG
jgi:hypothetical protein